MNMKKKITATILTAVLILAFCLPAYAQEVTDPKKVYKEDAFNIDEAKLIEDFHKGEVRRCNNYLEYLDGVIFNLNETARIKKEVVTNYMYLAQYNGYYATLIPQAQKEYIEAVAWVDAYKEYRKVVAADLRVRYNY